MRFAMCFSGKFIEFGRVGMLQLNKSEAIAGRLVVEPCTERFQLSKRIWKFILLQIYEWPWREGKRISIIYLPKVHSCFHNFHLIMQWLPWSSKPNRSNDSKCWTLRVIIPSALTFRTLISCGLLNDRHTTPFCSQSFIVKSVITSFTVSFCNLRYNLITSSASNSLFDDSIIPSRWWNCKNQRAINTWTMKDLTIRSHKSQPLAASRLQLHFPLLSPAAFTWRKMLHCAVSRESQNRQKKNASEKLFGVSISSAALFCFSLLEAPTTECVRANKFICIKSIK